MKKKWKCVLSLFLAVVMIGSSGYAAFAQPEEAAAEQPGKDLTGLIESVHMMQGGEDLFDRDTAPFEGGTLEVALDYDAAAAPALQEGDRLSVKIAAEDPEKAFLQMDYRTSTLKVLEDKGVKLADLDLSGRSGVEFRFYDVTVSFRAKITMPFQVDETALSAYFKKHPEEEKTVFRYKLQYDGKDTGRVLSFELQKREIKPAEVKFSKSRGVYQREGALGEGKILYNLHIGTKVRRVNEFIIYDTPDVNHAFEGDLRVYVPSTYSTLENRVLSRTNHYIEAGTIPDDEKMEIFVYDIYYLTETPADTFTPRQAGFEENTVIFPRKNPADGTIGVESMDTVTTPKNILLEKPMGEALSEAEQAMLEEKGGLHQAVGKGFKLRVKNFKGNGQNPGGYMSLVYTTTIRGNSPKLDDKGYPVYYNTACYYGQEIPTCKPGDENCTPIISEKTELKEVIEGRFTTEGKVTPGSVTAEVDEFSRVEFLKVAADNQGAPDLQHPLSGAVFNIYRIQADGSRQLAENKDKLKMENLITNDAGKLCLNDGKNTAVDLLLKRGSYIFEEVSAPEGWTVIKKETPVTVGFLDNRVVIVNAKDEPGGTGGEPGKPDKPDKPDEPGTPGKPDKPDKPDEPGTPGTPGKPDKPDEPGTPGKPDKPDKPDEPGTPGRPDHPEKPGKPGVSDKPAPSGGTDSNPENKQQHNQEIPRTGDSGQLLFWSILFSVTLAAILATLYKLKEKK